MSKSLAAPTFAVSELPQGSTDVLLYKVISAIFKHEEPSGHEGVVELQSVQPEQLQG
jgi:hypothetical protein